MLNVNDVTRLYLGVQGENGEKTITIDVAPWLVAHPGGTVSIWHKRNGDANPSATGATFDSDAGTVSWTPTSTDTYVAGEGEAEIRLTVGTVIKKSRKVVTGVSPAVTGAAGTLNSGWQYYINEVDGLKSTTKGYMDATEEFVEDAEAYAAGTRNGEPVESTDPAYHNNSKYYKEQAESAGVAQAENAESWAAGTRDGTPVENTDPAYHNNAKYWKEQAALEVNNAEDKAEDAEAWAKGTRGGTDVDSSDPTYHNNSKYWKEQAESSATAAENAKDTILGMTATASALGEGASPTVRYSGGVMAFGIPKGDHGVITSETEQYQNGDDGVNVPTGSWLDSRPTTPKGKWLWIKRKRTWNSATDVYSYEAYYRPLDGDAGITIDNEPTRGSDNVPQSGGTYTMIQTKVDKVAGKGLSTNDFTDALKNKLDGIAAGATANVVSDSLNDSSTTNALSAAKGKYLAEEVAKRGTTVNGEGPDENGNYQVSTVDFARQIVTDKEQSSEGEYLFRTTGGDASLSDGPAKLISILGRSKHTGIVQESITMTVTPAQREEGETPITATIDRDTFVAYVSTSGTTTLTYTSSWSADPTNYGVTVTGTPISGDVITIVYVKADRGTITNSDPDTFISTGWNLYNHTNGYAKVKKYSDTYGYRIDGTYTSIAFAETPTGTTTAITPDANGKFQITKDGYIIVTGGNSTDTCIYPTWSDWGSGHDGSWAAYSETTIDLTTIMGNFTYGLLQVGIYADEINFGQMKAISRIERMSYTAENLAAAEASGRPYDADTNYIYLVRETPVEYTFSTPTGSYTASDHGTEIVDGGTVAPYITTLYGENIVEMITHDFPEHLSAHDTEFGNVEAALAIVVNGDTAPQNITSGQYLFIKNHSTLATGGYHATAAITSGSSITSSNVAADSDGIANALSDHIVHKTTYTLPNDLTINAGSVVTVCRHSEAGIADNSIVLACRASSSNASDSANLIFHDWVYSGTYRIILSNVGSMNLTLTTGTVITIVYM